jgi:hypothetical protein
MQGIQAMRNLTVFLLLPLTIAGSTATPVDAAKHTTLLYPTTVVMVFADANGKTRTISETVQVEPGYNCDSLASETAMFKHPEGMTLKSATCRDKAGSSGPGGPAAVRLYFIVNGHVKVAILDHLGSTTFDMKSCSAVIQQQQAALVAAGLKQAAGGKFVSANCMPKPKYMSTYTNSHN